MTDYCAYPLEKVLAELDCAVSIVSSCKLPYNLLSEGSPAACLEALKASGEVWTVLRSREERDCVRLEVVHFRQLGELQK